MFYSNPVQPVSGIRRCLHLSLSLLEKGARLSGDGLPSIGEQRRMVYSVYINPTRFID